MKNINVSYINRVCYVVINGDIEFNESEQFLETINSLLNKPYPEIVIDLGNCNFIDSLGLSSINKAYDLAKTIKKELILCNLTKDCENIINMTTFWKKIPIKKDLASCLQAA